MERDGHYFGFDVDICRAIAAGILGDASKAAFVTVDTIETFRRHKEIDLVVRRLTWTPHREAVMRVSFGPVTFYDGQGFLVPRERAADDPARLADQPICVLNQEHFPEVLVNYFKDRSREIQLALVASDQEAEQALRQGRCGAYSADVSWLAAARAGFKDGVSLYDILPKLISKEPLAPMARAQDIDLVRVMRWTIFTLVEAEELGLNSRGIDALDQSSLEVQRFLAINPGIDVAVGPGKWSAALIGVMGNYGEIYDRNLGKNSAIRLDRGLNRLWTDGGLMYAPPLDR